MGKHFNGNSKISDEVIDKIYQELSRGVPIRHACTLAGISKETYYRWRRIALEDENCDPIYKKFLERIEEGIAMAIATRVEHIRLDNSWQSSAWWLERMAHEDFGRKQTIDAKVDAKVTSKDISKLFDDAKVNKILDEENIK